MICCLILALVCLLQIGAGMNFFPESKEFERVPMKSTTLSLFQDERGFVWAGTGSSLQRYNGRYFETYNFQSPESGLSSSSLGVNTACLIDGRTYLLGTTNGIVYFDAEKGRAEQYPNLKGQDIRSIQRLVDGRLVVATSNGAFLCVGEEETPIDPCMHQLCYQVVRQSENSYWICAYSGLYSYDLDTGSTQKIELPANCPDGALSAANDPARGCLWIGTGESLYVLPYGSTTPVRVSGFENNAIKVLLLDSKGLLWAGTERGLLSYSPEGKRIRSYRHDAKDDRSISNNVVWSLLETQDGRIWAGTNKGVSIFESEGLLTVFRWRDLFDSQDVNNISCIYVDNDQSIWLGGDSGIGHYDGKTNPWYREESGEHHINKNMVRDITRVSDGNLWLATDGGTYIYDDASKSFSNRLFADSSYVSFANWCYGVTESGTEKIYVSTYESGIFETSVGVTTPDRIQVANKLYSVHNGTLPDNAVKQVIEASDGSLWALMLKGGLVHITDGSTETFRQFNGKWILPQSMIESGNGNIWISSTGGLIELFPESSKTVFHDVKAAEVWPLFERDSVLWAMSSDRVVSITNEETRIILLDSSDYSCGAEYDEKTIVVAGGEKIALLPTSGKREVTPPVLYFTSARLNGEALDIGREYESGNVILDRDLDCVEKIELPWARRNLELDIYTPSGIPLEYGMEAEGEEWYALGKTPLTLFFPGLSVGSHTIVFRNAINGEEIRSLRIKILAPWYSRWYMIVLYSIIVIFMVFLISTLVITRGHLQIETAQKEFYIRQAQENEQQLEMLRRLSAANNSDDTPETSLIKKLSAYIQENIDNSDLSVQVLADRMKMPSKQLYRKVKAATGLTIVEFVRGLRLQKAAELLSSGRYNVSETMNMVGFSNLSYFTRCFMELYGVSPKQYMEK